MIQHVSRVELVLPVRVWYQSSVGYNNRRRKEKELTKYTLRNTSTILYYITYCSVCIYTRTLQNRSRFETNAILTKHYTSRDNACAFAPTPTTHSGSRPSRLIGIDRKAGDGYSKFCCKLNQEEAFVVWRVYISCMRLAVNRKFVRNGSPDTYSKWERFKTQVLVSQTWILRRSEELFVSETILTDGISYTVENRNYIKYFVFVI